MINMAIVAGIDIGSSSAKALLLDNDRIVSSAIIRTSANITGIAREAVDLALRSRGLTLERVNYIVCTGYGRVNVPFAQKNLTEISCHARGSHWLFPEIRTILDMGGQDCKVIRCDNSGRVLRFLMNDKCAAGTGRYLERIARYLDVPLEEIGPRSRRPKKGPAMIDTFCPVYAENDVLRLQRLGEHINDILAGAVDAVTERVMSLLQRLNVEEALSLSGGIAKNIGVVQRLEERLHLKVRIASDPQLVGALGAALFARDTLSI